MIKIKKHWKMIVVSIYAMVITTALLLQFKKTKIIAAEQSHKLVQAQEKANAFAHTIGDLNVQLEELKKIKSDLYTKSDNLKNHVAAFSKQAATCVALKAKLGIKE